MTTEDISNLSPGTYTVVITDDNGCTATTNATVTEPDELDLSTVVTNIGCSGGSTGAIDLTVSGGISPYQYFWTPGSATTEDISNLTGGTYTVVVTDDNGCTATTNADVIACSTGVYTVSGTETWTSQTRTFCDDLIIPNGATLQLTDSRLEFARYNSSSQPVNLIIEPGGKLEMTNSTLTNLSGCDEMWHGVIVRGDGSNNVSDNGLIQTFWSASGNNTISNAERGIATRSTFQSPFSILFGGGMLQLLATDFINNRTGISLSGKLYPNPNYVYGCSFTWNNNRLFTPANNLGVNSHIRMARRAGQLFIGYCEFENLHPTSTYRGHGIYAQGSQGVWVYASDFASLENGIRIKNGNGINFVASGTTNQWRCEFTDNNFGILATGVDNLYVVGDIDNNVHNIFTIPDASGNDVAGIHIENSIGIEIAFNRFEGNATSACGTGPCSYGIVADNTNAAGGRIFRNDFFATNFGVQTEGDNPELNIRCNRFELDPDPQGTNEAHPDYAWASLETECTLPVLLCPRGRCFYLCLGGHFGTLKDQGDDQQCPFDHTKAAGNRWMTNNSSIEDNDCPNNPYRDKDIFVEKYVLPFHYNHHVIDDIGNRKVIPDCATSWWENRRQPCDQTQEATWPFSCSDDNPGTRIVHPDSGNVNNWNVLDTIQDQYDDYAQKKQQLEEDADSLRSLLDDGSTSELLDTILDMDYSALQKDTILRRHVPLSDDVLMAVLLDSIYYGVKPTYYPAQLRNLLVMNVPLSQRVLQILHLPQVVLDEIYMDSIMSAQLNGPFDTLRMAFVDTAAGAKYYNSEMRQTENVLRFWNGYRDAVDTTGTSNYYETYLRNTHTLTSKKLLAELLFEKDSIADAETVLDTVDLLSTPEDSLETYWFKEYMELMIELGDSIAFMDSVQLAQMYEIAESGAHIAPKAHAILYLADTVVFEYPIEKIEEEPAQKTSGIKTEKPKQEIVGSTTGLDFKLYPNPNNGKMILEYKLDDNSGKFSMFDIAGRPLADFELIKGDHKIIIEQQGLSEGIYLFKIANSRRTLHNGRVIIMR